MKGSEIEDNSATMVTAIAQTISADILHTIFLHLPPVHFNCRSKLDPRRLSPMNLSLVCRSWRKLVQSHPSLWGSVHITYRNFPSFRPPPKRVSHYFEKWLQNSIPAPLDINMYVSWARNDPEYDKIMALAFRECHRWRDAVIHIIVNPDEGDPFTIQCTPSSSSIVLTVEVPPSFPPAVLDLSKCISAPEIPTSQLRNLAIFSPATWIFPSPADALHLPNLRTLGLRTDIGSHFGDMLDLLRANPNITNLRAIACNTSHSQQMETYSIRLPRLTLLGISSANKAIGLRLLSYISCPSIQSFAYEVIGSQTEPEDEKETIVTLPHLHGFADFLFRSISNSPTMLRNLTLQFYAKPGAIPPESHNEHARALESLLKVHCALRVLEIEGLVVDEQLGRNLTICDDAGERREDALCPSLKRIAILNSDTFGLESTTVVDMIVSRWSPKGRNSLKTVTIGIPKHSIDFHQSWRLMKCKEEGLDLTLTGPMGPEGF